MARRGSGVVTLVRGLGQDEIRTWSRAATPPAADTQVGDLWIDLSGTPTLKKCTSISPVTWVSVEGGGAGAPTDAVYIVQTANGSLSAERVLTDTATVTWDFSVAGQAKATAIAAASGPGPLARLFLLMGG